MAVSFNGKHLAKFIRPEEYEAIYPQVELAHNQLESKTGAGNDFLGWLDLPVTYDKEEFARIKEAAQKIRSDSDVLLVAGIGGSYLGARAVVEAVKGLYHNEADDGLKIYFCGNTISPTALNDIIKLTKGKRFSINVISKSGTTTETALAFRVLRKLLEDSVGTEEANNGPRQRHAETAGNRAGLADLRRSRRRRRTLLRPDCCRPAAHCLRRYRHRRAHAGRCRWPREVRQAVPGQRRLPLRHDPQHPVPQGQER